MPAPLRTRPTRAGLALGGLSVLVAGAAANTGANLLYACFGLMASTLACAALLSRRSLRGLELRVALPGLVEAGRRFAAEIALGGVRAPRAVVRLPPLAMAVPVLAGSGRFEANGLPRQILRQLSIEAVSSWPFGLIATRQAVAVAVHLDVHPRLAPPGRLPSGWRRTGQMETDLAGSGGSLRELRPYVPGDSPRRIHWPTSARAQTLIVREDLREASPQLTILVDTAMPAGDAFEANLERAAGGVRDALASGLTVELRTPERRIMLSHGELPRGLRFLAGLEPARAVAAGWDRTAGSGPALRIASPAVRSGGAPAEPAR